MSEEQKIESLFPDTYVRLKDVLNIMRIKLMDLEADQDKGDYGELCENKGAREVLEEMIEDINNIAIRYEIKRINL